YEYAGKALGEHRMKLSAVAHYEVLIVPIYLYKRLFGSGADLAAPRAALQNLGFPCYFVETQDDGAVETNADLVAEAIISASKSSSEVALALTKLGSAKTHHVVAWINTAGVLQGTALTDEYLFQELEFLVGHLDAAGKESLTTTRGRERFASF